MLRINSQETKIMKRQEIIFEGEVVGYFEHVGAEMNRIYGKWYPLDNELTKQFIQRLQNTDLTVQLKEDETLTKFLMTYPPDEDWIELRFF